MTRVVVINCHTIVKCVQHSGKIINNDTRLIYNTTLFLLSIYNQSNYIYIAQHSHQLNISHKVNLVYSNAFYYVRLYSSTFNYIQSHLITFNCIQSSIFTLVYKHRGIPTHFNSRDELLMLLDIDNTCKMRPIIYLYLECSF